MAVNQTQDHYRFRTDSNAADAGTPTWGAAQDTTFQPRANTAFALRFVISSIGTTTNASNPWQIFASKNGGAYAAVTTATTGVLSADRTAGASADNSSIATANFRLSAGTGTAQAGQYDDTGATANYVLTKGNFTEFEFGLKLDSTLVVGDTIDYRVYFNSAPINTYTVTPRSTIGYYFAVPTVASLALAGNAPTLNLTETPSVAALALAEAAPALRLQIPPSVAALSLAGVSFGLNYPITVPTEIAN